MEQRKKVSLDGECDHQSRRTVNDKKLSPAREEQDRLTNFIRNLARDAAHCLQHRIGTKSVKICTGIMERALVGNLLEVK